MSPDEHLVSLQEAVDRLSVVERTVRRYIDDGHLVGKSVRQGFTLRKITMITEESLQEFINGDQAA